MPLPKESAVSRTSVAVDAMGGDCAPGVVVAGAVKAARSPDLEICLVGPEAVLRAELRRLEGSHLPIEVFDSFEAIPMGEKVSRAILRGRSSIHQGLELVRSGRANAFFSAGNTAACWAIARQTLGTLAAVERPALAAVLPNRSGTTVLLDAGANTSCRARHLEDFAVMGNAYARDVLGVARPRVGLVSMGEEETKGSDMVREAHEVLKAAALHFVGNIEGYDLFSGRVDVAVTDGFTGNVALKAAETLSTTMIELMGEELRRSLIRRGGAWLCRGALASVRRRIDSAERGGAPLLGVRGCCVIGHGRSDASAVEHGIGAAASFYRSGLNERIEAELHALGRGEPVTPAASA
jgi:glycerol-3-phosphate acyltransferase PlsX